jgi:predicted P-loop ATPase
MFFPTASKDGVFGCKDFTGDIFDADKILAEAKNDNQWKWEDKAEALAAKQANPYEKDGIIGEFCRAFSIVDMLTDPELLGNQYEATTNPKRFLLKGSHSVPGVIVYPYKGADGSIIEDAFMYSHHAKDPTCNTLCNSFDAYRLHKFGDLDTEESLKKAIKGIRDMPKMQEALKALRKKQMEKDFADDEDIDLSGYDVQEPKAETEDPTVQEPEAKKKKHLDIVFEINEKLVKRGQNDPRPANIKSNFDRILLEDPVFSGLRKNLFLDRIEIEGKLPWRNKEMQRRYGNVWCDSDLVAALSYIARYYGDMHNKQMLEDSIETIADKRAYHPIVEKLSHLPAWDGVKRAESIFIDYLGAEDTPYVRAVTMKTLQALVERVKRPGCKYDYMIILDGGQGIGKTTMFSRLSLGYYTDSLSLQDMNNLQKSFEQTQGVWIVEISELAGAKKAEVEFIKAFVSRTEDRCRKAYGRYVDISPRQFVLVGTTNETSDYLRDHTGNRRFYPVHCAGIMGEDGKVDIYYAFNHFTKDVVDQVWAEVLQSLKDEAFSAELPADLKSEAESRQAAMMEKDDRLETVQKYVDMLVPADWYKSYDEDQKRQYTQRYLRDTLDENDDMGTEPLKYITPAHLWQYAFEQPIVKLDNFQTRAMGKLLRQCDLVYKVVKDPKTKKCVKGWVKTR